MTHNPPANTASPSASLVLMITNQRNAGHLICTKNRSFPEMFIFDPRPALATATDTCADYKKLPLPLRPNTS